MENGIELLETQKLIKISKTHYIIVDNSKIKKRNWVYSFRDKWINRCVNTMPVFEITLKCKKITHSFGKELEGVINKPVSEIEEIIYGYSINEIAIKYEKEKFDGDLGEYPAGIFIDGFETCKELEKDKLFSRSDLWWAYVRGFQANEEKKEPLSDFEEVFKSLQKTEWDITIDGQGKIIILRK